MIFLLYSGVMDADLKSLEEKISKLVTLCGDLREENAQLRGDISQAKLATDSLKSKMLLASNKLEGLLGTLPDNLDAADAVSLSMETS